MSTSSIVVMSFKGIETTNYVVNGVRQPSVGELNEVLDALTDLFNDVMYLGFADECNESFQKASKVLDKFERVGGAE